MTIEALIGQFGPAGMFIGYLIWLNQADRKERDARRKSDVRLALALDRFVTRMTGQPLNLSEGAEDEQG